MILLTDLRSGNVKKGLFITFEGNDGCGKTTISTLVMQELQQQGLSVLYTREPRIWFFKRNW